MNVYRYLLLIAVIFQVSFLQSQKINGVSFVASYGAIDAKHVQPVLKVNANYVALMPFAFMKDLANPSLVFNTDRQWFGETEKGLVQYANEFEKVSVKVMVKPQIWVSKGQFTGLIKMMSEENWTLFEANYEKYILSYAVIAQKIQAEMLCIGTELGSFVTQRPKFWNELIAKIKRVYKGKLTYAANWDAYKRVSFWGQLDYIGVDAYFPLSIEKTPTVADFEEGWQPHKKEIKIIQRRYDKPILFTEYGYRSVDFNGLRPWESNQVEGAINLMAQASATQAIYNQFWKEDWFAGGFIWKWFHNHSDSGGTENNRFTPQNKPTEKILRTLYKQ